MIRLFCGSDPRETVGLQVFTHSVWSRSSQPVSITPLSGRTDGTNAFTLSRFLVPYLCGFQGFAIWADGSDMLCLEDIAKLWKCANPYLAVQVVKHDYKTRHAVKYLGQPNLDYERKNWSSLILWNCGHFSNRLLTPETVDQMPGTELHRFSWLKDEYIGALQPEWNYLVGETQDPYHDSPLILHYTIGLPVWDPYSGWPYSWDWRNARENMLAFQEWKPTETNRPSTDAAPQAGDTQRPPQGDS